MKFSKTFKKFEDWFGGQDKRTGYTKRIARLHSLYPKASLDQLRGHGTKGLARQRAVPVYLRSWNSLNPREKDARERALGVLSEARKTGRSLYRLSKEHGLTDKVVLKATNAFRKVKGRWVAKRSDRISRIMAINERGKEIFIEVTDSRQASIIGRYQAAVRKYFNTGDASVLLDFKGKRVNDASRKSHLLETDPRTLREIAERREEPEFYDIYKVD